MAERKIVFHAFEPFYREDSEVLILGTMPSPKSVENGFYYGHPQNRFWSVLAAVLEEPLPVTRAEREALLARHRIALWDVLASCEITGAADGSIRAPVPNDIASLLQKTRITRIFTTGKTAERLYARHCLSQTGIPSVCLPSPSPANCAVGMDALVAAYRALLPQND